jgi:hypothetical protein
MPWHWIAEPTNWAKAVPPLPTTSARSITASISVAFAILFLFPLGMSSFSPPLVSEGSGAPFIAPHYPAHYYQRQQSSSASLRGEAPKRDRKAWPQASCVRT